MFVDHAWFQVGFNEGDLHFRRDFSEAPSTSIPPPVSPCSSRSHQWRHQWHQGQLLGSRACVHTDNPLAQLRVGRAGAARVCPLQLLTGGSGEPNRCCLTSCHVQAPDPPPGELISLMAHKKLISFSGLGNPEFVPAANIRRKIPQPGRRVNSHCLGTSLRF